MSGLTGPTMLVGRTAAVNRRVSGASAARAPRRAPWPAGTRASRTSAAASAAGARTPRSTPAGHNRHRKNFIVITLAAPGTASPAGGFRLLTLPIVPALPVAFLFAGCGDPIFLLRLPPRPNPRRLPAPVAAIALPRVSRPKAPLASLEQASPRPRPAHPPLPPTGLLIFGMVCRILRRAHGRSLLPDALALEGNALLSGAQPNLRLSTELTTLSHRGPLCLPG